MTHSIIGGAIQVHRTLGPGLIESLYEWALCCELQLRELPVETQRNVTVRYRSFSREEPLRFDLLVAGCVLIEGKCVGQILPVHKAQLLSYMRLLDVPLGLLINFSVSKLTDGISRVILPNADK